MAARVACLLLIALGACSRAHHGNAAAGAPSRRVVRDTWGRDVSLPAVVRRVVSLAPSTTEVLYAVGAGPLVAGADKFSDYPPAVAAVEKVGADIDPSLERIARLRPDVIFTANTANTPRSVEAIEKLGLPVYLSRADTIADVLTDVTRIASAVGRADEGERLRRDLESRLRAVRARVAGRPVVSALVVVWPEPLIVAGGPTHVDEMLRVAGGVNVAHDSPQPYPTYSVERVLVQAPEVILFGTHANANNAVPPLFARLTSLPAVRAGRVHAIDGDLVFRPGPRLIDGIERLAALLHPEAASAADGGAR